MAVGVWYSFDLVERNFLLISCLYSCFIHYLRLPIIFPLKWFLLWNNIFISSTITVTLQWRHNERNGVSNHRRPDCLLNRLFMRRSKKTAKLRVTGLCEGNSPVTGEFPTQRASNAENISISWRNHFFYWKDFSIVCSTNWIFIYLTTLNHSYVSFHLWN